VASKNALAQGPGGKGGEREEGGRRTRERMKREETADKLLKTFLRLGAWLKC
jgi:hypothetical protein